MFLPHLIRQGPDKAPVGFVSRIGRPLASEGGVLAEMPKNMAILPQSILFRDVAAVAAQ
jgi:hypothetical protein